MIDRPKMTIPYFVISNKKIINLIFLLKSKGLPEENIKEINFDIENEYKRFCGIFYGYCIKTKGTTLRAEVRQNGMRDDMYFYTLFYKNTALYETVIELDQRSNMERFIRSSPLHLEALPETILEEKLTKDVSKDYSLSSSRLYKSPDQDQSNNKQLTESSLLLQQQHKKCFCVVL